MKLESNKWRFWGSFISGKKNALYKQRGQESIVYGDGAIAKSNWFANFRSKNFDLQDGERPPVVVDDDQIETMNKIIYLKWH